MHGEEWQVHGGGFYHIQKYLVAAPAALPEHLTWFKWESYATWLSGFALMVVVYYLGADIYLVDLDKTELTTWAAILISLGVLAAGWIGYDLLCKSPLGQRPTMLMPALYLLLVMMAYLLDQLFTGRAAFLHLGAVTATIMSFNVLAIIIPNQRIAVADLKAGRVPDAKYGDCQTAVNPQQLSDPAGHLCWRCRTSRLSHSTSHSWGHRGAGVCSGFRSGIISTAVMPAKATRYGHMGGDRCPVYWDHGAVDPACFTGDDSILENSENTRPAHPA